jgi:hypothetical protein
MLFPAFFRSTDVSIADNPITGLVLDLHFLAPVVTPKHGVGSVSASSAPMLNINIEAMRSLGFSCLLGHTIGGINS